MLSVGTLRTGGSRWVNYLGSGCESLDTDFVVPDLATRHCAADRIWRDCGDRLPAEEFESFGGWNALIGMRISDAAGA